MRAGPGASLVVTSELTSESHLGDGAPPDLSGVWIQDAITSVTRDRGWLAVVRMRFEDQI